jgi:hypothetical protein
MITLKTGLYNKNELFTKAGLAICQQLPTVKMDVIIVNPSFYGPSYRISKVKDANIYLYKVEEFAPQRNYQY